MSRLAIGMQKGGVGKSTTAINLAGALASPDGPTDEHDVLVVDADPQGFCTITLGFSDYYVSDETNLYDILTDIDKFGDINEIIQQHEEFDVVPAHGRNFSLEKELWSESRSQERLGMALDELDDDYDYVLIDAPPNLGPLADGAIIGAGHVLFASKADTIATFSMNLLMQEISTLEKEFRTEIGSVGAVVNQVTDDNIAEERLEWFVDHIGDENTFVVPETVAVEGAFNQGFSVFGHTPENRHREKKAKEVQDIYHGLAAHVEGYYDGR